MPIQLKLLLATFFWGATPTIGRALAAYDAPFIIVCGRFFVATLCLCWFAAMARQFVSIPRRYWLRFTALGITGITLHNGLMFAGMAYISASSASIILGLIALQVVLLDLVFFRRVPRALTLFAVALGFVGAAWAISGGDLRALGTVGIGPGEVLIFLSGLSWAAYSVLGREVLELYSALTVTTYASAIGFASMLPFVFARPDVAVALVTDPAAGAMILFLGVLGSAFGFLWYYQGVVHLGTVGAALYINLVPVFGILSAAVFLGETIDAAVIAGGVLVVGALMLVNSPRAAVTS